MIESINSVEKVSYTPPCEKMMLNEVLGKNIRDEELQLIGNGFFNRVYRHNDEVYKIPKNLPYFGQPSFGQLSFENAIYRSCRVPAPYSDVIPILDGKTGVIATKFVPDFRPLTLFDTIYKPQIRDQFLDFLELDRVLTEGFGCAIDLIDFEAGKLYATNYGLPLSFLLDSGHNIPDLILSNNLVVSPDDKLITIDNGVLWLKNKLNVANPKWMVPHNACHQAAHKFILNPLEDYLKRLN